MVVREANIVMDHTPSAEQEMHPRKEINQSKENKMIEGK